MEEKAPPGEHGPPCAGGGRDGCRAGLRPVHAGGGWGRLGARISRTAVCFAPSTLVTPCDRREGRLVAKLHKDISKGRATRGDGALPLRLNDAGGGTRPGTKRTERLRRHDALRGTASSPPHPRTGPAGRCPGRALLPSPCPARFPGCFLQTVALRIHGFASCLSSDAPSAERPSRHQKMPVRRDALLRCPARCQSPPRKLRPPLSGARTARHIRLPRQDSPGRLPCLSGCPQNNIPPPSPKKREPHRRTSPRPDASSIAGPGTLPGSAPSPGLFPQKNARRKTIARFMFKRPGCRAAGN